MRSAIHFHISHTLQRHGFTHRLRKINPLKNISGEHKIHAKREKHINSWLRIRSVLYKQNIPHEINQN